MFFSIFNKIFSDPTQFSCKSYFPLVFVSMLMSWQALQCEKG